MRWVNATQGASRTLAVLLLLLCLDLVFAGDLVQWVDEHGVIHFSDSLETVPPKYRGKVKLEKLKDNPLPHQSRVEGASPSSTNEPLTGGSKLKSYEVPFEAYVGRAQRVIVTAKFNDSVTARMLLDTGAPGLMISPRLANQLGILSGDEGKVLVQTGGIGGSIPAIKTFIEKVQVGEAQDTFIPATITPSISGAFEGLIGMDFMSKYSFKIDSVKQVVLFEEVEPNPDWRGGRSERWWRDQYRELHLVRAAWERFAPKAHWHVHYPAGKFAALQVSEVDKLIDRLDRYANQHFVPRNWR